MPPEAERILSPPEPALLLLVPAEHTLARSLLLRWFAVLGPARRDEAPACLDRRGPASDRADAFALAADCYQAPLPLQEEPQPRPLSACQEQTPPGAQE